MAAKKYNFKGLDEIFGESVSDLVDNLEGDNKKAKELSQEVSILSLTPNPYQPRKIFDDESIEELAESIKVNGIIQPVIVSEISKNKYQIIAGERRFRAAKLARLNTIPVVVTKLSEQQIEEFALIENIQRVDLTDIEEAIAYKKLAKTLNLKQDAIAKRVGKSRSHVANIMRLLNLPDYIQQAMLDKTINMGQAKPLLTILSNENLLKKVYERILRENLSSRGVEDLIKKLQKGEKLSAIDKKKDSSLVGVENKLMIKLGAKINIDNSKLVIKYKDTNDLNRILEIIGFEFDD